jgi:alkylation response protein AidB-like acyl-CoA dehydrogenase
MWNYIAPVRDMQFVINELLDAPSEWQKIPRFAEVDGDTVPQILGEASRFATDVLAPTNADGDAQGCRLVDGHVITPAGFPAVYRQYCEGGWPALACDPENGGQGLPQLLNAAVYEMLNSTNHAWTMYAGLAHGAHECIRAHGSEFLKSTYLPKIVSGEWLATMCLTEPQAGTDVGLLRTQAVHVGARPVGALPLGEQRDALNERYALNGSKIFISGGDQDMSPNIVRLPDAPAGSRGISLFLVPKFQGEHHDQPNGVCCDGIEHKMGIKGSATCVLRFKDAHGWLIGQPHRGLAAMFVMMNAARLHVGLQGLGHAEAAYQNAHRYAAERVQMRALPRRTESMATTAPAGTPAPAAGPAASPIIQHAGVRRTLMTLQAMVQGGRALAYWSAHLLDVADHHPDAARRAGAHDLVALLTPVVKAFLTENGFELSSAALQIWGGYGYVREFGIEQTVRDSRIAMIYEGTNEIQAIDLLVRKVVGDKGAKFNLVLDELRDEAAACNASPKHQSIGSALAMGNALSELHAGLSEATAAIVDDAMRDPELPHRVASDFLRLVGLSLLGVLWARMARIAAPKAQSDAFYRDKLTTAAFYFDYLLPEATYRLALLKRGRSPLPWLEALE